MTRRIRTILPEHHIVVDMDDGYADVEVACHAAWSLEQAGASAIVLEDQQRPRRCGHLPGKRILPIDDYIAKLKGILETRRDMLIIARTDAVGEETLERVVAYAEAGADMVAVAVRVVSDDVTPSKLKQWCSERISPDCIPERWFVIPEIPKTDRGKINREAVRNICMKENH